jgi:hypothetical protein
MKYFWMFSLVLIAACGRVDVPSDAKLEPIKNTPKLIAGGELSDFIDICNALKNSTYIFAETRKTCTEIALVPIGNAIVMLEEVNGKLEFNEGNRSAYFSEIETIDMGNFADICSNLSNLVTPMSKDGINYVHFSTASNSSDCPAAVEEQCVKFEKGVKKINSEGVVMTDIHTREWIRVKLISDTQSLIGFWSYQKRLAKGGCVKGYNISRTATLDPK